MAKKEYGWAAGAIPEIAPHSLAKHRILREYVERYLHVLTARHGMEVFRLALVDGFAGGGEYRDARTQIIQPGSPQILIDAVRSAEARINAGRSKPLRIDANYVFVEKDPAVVRYLHEVLRKRGDSPKGDGVLQVIEGAFEEKLDSIIAHVKSRGRAHRAIFVLDQYGYTSVPIAMLSRIFKELPNAEVFLTLAVGWIAAYLPNARAAAQKVGVSKETIDRLCANPDEELDLSDPQRRPDLLAIQQLLHHAFTSEVKSKYYTPFFIVSRESNRPYWFLHMANSARANDVVKTLHWEIENHFEHFGRPGLVMLGYDPSVDPEVTRQPAFQFDDPAKVRTRDTLLEDLPRRFSEQYPAGVSFGTLFQETCNETPATKDLLRRAIANLCVEKVLEKVGVEGERRAPETLPHDDDLVRLPAQKFFVFPKW